jgi:uracil-DNA glycosylase
MASIQDLLQQIEEEARKGDMSLDLAPYKIAKRDPYVPILFTGNVNAKVAVMARDLGWKEVTNGQPLIGDAGQRVRRTLYRALFGKEAPTDDIELKRAMEHILFTNTVPYKPVGNKAYPNAVKERFRPYVLELLTCHWKGDYLITMGTEAFMWYTPYVEPGAIEAFWKRPDRYEAELPVTLEAACDGKPVRKAVTLAPLPHPSPLNRTYLELFPELLEKRLAASPLR